jgi:DNA-binding HxlR family transcriptional regulator/putative sterol carrier protein
MAGVPVQPINSRSYNQLCGIATALDLVGDRWALLVVRELLFGPQRFGDLADGLPGIGTNTLSTRLKQLETGDIVRRTVLPLPDRGIAYELTEYGQELRPILIALGRWGAQSMGPTADGVSARSRWLMAAMLAFHTEADVGKPTTWQLRLDNGVFAVVAEGRTLVINAGEATMPDMVLETSDAVLHALLTGQVSPRRAIAAGELSIDGDVSYVTRLLGLFAFPAPA